VQERTTAHADGTITVRLTYPVTWPVDVHPGTPQSHAPRITELRVNRMTVAALRALNTPDPSGAVPSLSEIRCLAILCRVDVAVIERLDVEDFPAVQGAAVTLMGKAPRETGETLAVTS
jgi:hypothetical protein